jgi:hypothetical protein
MAKDEMKNLGFAEEKPTGAEGSGGKGQKGQLLW